MRLRNPADDSAFDGLTAEDIRRIRGGAEASVTPGLEGLAKLQSHSESKSSRAQDRTTATESAKNRKRGRRA